MALPRTGSAAGRTVTGRVRRWRALARPAAVGGPRLDRGSVRSLFSAPLILLSSPSPVFIAAFLLPLALLVAGCAPAGPARERQGVAPQARSRPAASDEGIVHRTAGTPDWPELALSYLERRAGERRVRIACRPAAGKDGRTVVGAPRRVVFVHGTPGSAGAFLGYLRQAEAHRPFDLVTVDRPGFGRTRPRHAVPSLADQARALRMLLDVPPDAPKPILVGHSLGAPIVAKAAALYPDRVGGLVVLAGAFDPALERVHPLQYLGEVPPFVWLLSRSLRNANRELIPLGRELAVLRAELPRVRQPVLVLHGTRDRLVPFVNTRYLPRFLKHAARLEIRPLVGFDHFIPWTAPDAVWRAIEDMDAWLRCRSRSVGRSTAAR